MPRVLITGATGFLGRAVTERFLAAGWSGVALSRDPVAARSQLPRSVEAYAWEGFSDAVKSVDAVVHLAGESIAGGLWSRARKQKLLASRVAVTRRLVDEIERFAVPPAAFVAASGMGYYGHRGDALVRVEDPPGDDFLGTMAAAWERESLRAERLGIRTAFVRLGMILGNGGGALPPMRVPFRIGLGAVLGGGRQYWPWIHRDDAADMFYQIVTNPELRGAIHGVAGVAVTQRTFSETLAGVLRRPLWLRIPERVLRLGIGEMADLFLHGQRAHFDPRFAFRHATLAHALADLHDRRDRPSQD